MRKKIKKTFWVDIGDKEKLMITLKIHKSKLNGERYWTVTSSVRNARIPNE